MYLVTKKFIAGWCVGQTITDQTSAKEVVGEVYYSRDANSAYVVTACEAI